MNKSPVYFFIHVVFGLCVLGIVLCEGRCGVSGKPKGECVEIRKCTPMTNFINEIVKPYADYIIKKVNSYSCDYKNGRRYVCCPLSPIIDPIKLLPKDCGYRDIDDKVRNGNIASLNEFPWMALLVYKTGQGLEKYRCGGSIINDQYILTAAHCITEDLEAVRIGEYNIHNNVDCGVQPDGSEACNSPAQTVKVVNKIVHPKFNSTANDIGLIRVAKINFNSDSVRPVCLPLGENMNRKLHSAIVAGWGSTEGYEIKQSEVLQKAEVQIVPQEICFKAYENQKKVITKEHICVGGMEDKGFCRGDSGGPLQADGIVDGDIRYVQHGVLSFGPTYCGLDGVPGVAASVDFHMSWILNQLEP